MLNRHHIYKKGDYKDMKKSGISLIKMSIYNICIVVFLAILMILGLYLSANGATPAENQEIKAETISSEELEELEEPIEDEDIENTKLDKPNEVTENQIPSENEDDDIDNQKDVSGYWGKDSQGWHFYDSEGIMQKGFCIINGKQYYFSSDGVMRSGWQNIDRSWYYFGEANDGSGKKDWQYIGGSWYYFEPNYVMVSDTIKEISGSKYAFSASGAMLLGTFKFKDDIYATKATGAIKESGWILYNKKWYYKEENGEIIKNSMHNIGGLKYSFDEDGVMRSGWQNIDGSWYYFGEANDGSGKKDWQYIGGSWYYFEPNYVMVSDTIKEISGSKYAFSASGAMLLGTFKFKDDIYATKATGAIKESGWILYNKKWYYKEENGEIIKNSMHNIGGLKYSFDEDGVMRSGWQNIEGSWYYFGEANDGSAKKDWQYIGGSWYYFEPNYVMVSDTIKEISGSKYAFSASGAMLLGKFTFNKKTYVTDVNGSLIPYDGSAEAKAREIASELGYNIYRALNYCAGMSRYYLTSNGRTSYPIMSSSEYAIYGYKNYGGDCLVMASAFKYLAQACGYNCTQWFGWVGSSTHSWCEIDGYVYDPNFINATNRGKYGFAYGTRGTWRYSKSYTM